MGGALLPSPKPYSLSSPHPVTDVPRLRRGSAQGGCQVRLEDAAQEHRQPPTPAAAPWGLPGDSSSAPQLGPAARSPGELGAVLAPGCLALGLVGVYI